MIRSCFAVALMGLLVGCGDAKMSSSKAKGPRYLEKPPGGGEAAQVEGERKDPAGRKPPAAPEPQPRMVIYTGRVELIVEDFDEAQAKLVGVIDAHKAYVSHSETTGEPNTPRSGKWTLRVPVAEFDAVMDAVAGLGEVARRPRTATT